MTTSPCYYIQRYVRKKNRLNLVHLHQELPRRGIIQRPNFGPSFQIYTLLSICAVGACRNKFLMMKLLCKNAFATRKESVDL